MLKIPFIEHTVVGLEVTEELVRWVEMNKLGNKISLHGFGEIRHNGSEAALKSAFAEVKDAIKSDAYHTTATFEKSVLEIRVEDLPYVDDEKELAMWIDQQISSIQDEFETEVMVGHHVVQIDEDSGRAFFQVMDQAIIDEVNVILSECGFHPELITSGIFEPGYTQIFEPDFVEDLASTLVQINSIYYLTIYNQGIVHNAYPITSSEPENAILQADSYLKSEESNNEQAISSIPLSLFLEMDVETTSLGVSRELLKASPMESTRGFNELDARFGKSVGAALKLFYPDLDSINFADPGLIHHGIKNHDKKEAIRLAVLLFAPLIFFLFIIFGTEKIIDYQLIESNQVMENIGGNIALVNEQRKELFGVRDQFLEVRSLIENRAIVAPIFEILAVRSTEKVWLNELKIEVSESSHKQVRVEGVAENNQVLTQFLKTLEEDRSVIEVQLLFSNSIDQIQNPGNNDLSSIPIGALQFELIFQVL
jgi:hypothetical protein